MYNEIIMDHFKNPRNVGQIEDADGVGEAENSVCGDTTKLYLMIQEGKIRDSKFKTFGCTAAIAASSMLTQMLKGLRVEEAVKITKEDVSNALGGLPPLKVHCSVLAEDAVKSAVEDYKQRAR